MHAFKANVNSHPRIALVGFAAKDRIDREKKP